MPFAWLFDAMCGDGKGLGRQRRHVKVNKIDFYRKIIGVSNPISLPGERHGNAAEPVESQPDG